MLAGYLRARAEVNPDALAILAQGRAPLSYAGLLDQVTRTVVSLNRAGYGRGDRIALALPPGPETTVALLAALAGCVCVPLNPASGAVELTSLLLRSRADVLLTSTDSGHAAQAAAEHAIPVAVLEPAASEAAGRFRLRIEGRARRAYTGFSTEHELSALFPTSGTTALPKLIPLTQGDICCHGERAMRYLGLTLSDRCLDFLAPFHHDAVAVSILSTVFAGASGVYPRAPSAPHFLSWAREFRPTWCAAPPPFFRLLSLQIHRSAPDLGLHTLFTCGAPLDEDDAAALERTFRAALRNSYGATECGGISINPPPPAVRKRGSAGVSVGLEIRIVDELGEPLPAGQHGEVAVRGPGVFRGYEMDPDENVDTFFGEWYRTGDEGYLDGDGYLFLTGRLKEVINRGGEKIAPLEIDQVLCSHPDVQDAATFPIPHPLFGEDIAAAVVLKGPRRGVDEIRRFASERLSAFKVPNKLLIVSEIPRGPTGKVQRIHLAARLADALARAELIHSRPESLAAPTSDHGAAVHDDGGEAS